MIIYCAGAIKGDKKYQKYYKQIIQIVDSLGHTALSELNRNFSTPILLTDKQIFSRDIKWLKNSKLVIAEISGPSLGVGFEIAYALYYLKKPVLALYHASANSLSAMITGCDSDLFSIKKYSDAESLNKIIADYLKSGPG
jgi:hypothetical protein